MHTVYDIIVIQEWRDVRWDVNLKGSWYRDSQLFPSWWNVGFHLFFLIHPTQKKFVFCKKIAIQNENANWLKNYWSQTTQSDPSKRVSSASLEYLVEVHNFSASLLASSQVSFQPFFTQLNEIFERCSKPWLVVWHRGWKTTQLYGDYDKPL